MTDILCPCGLSQDRNLSSRDYSWLGTAFYLGYTAFEPLGRCGVPADCAIPANMLTEMAPF